LIKGSHIVVRRRFAHDSGYIFQAKDGRVVFALPFAGEFTLIGTTDENFVGDLKSPAPDPDEITYLCDAVNLYFREKVTPDELIWSFSGVRGLYDDGSNKPEDVTRDYQLVLDAPTRAAPLLTVYGGKITTHRKLAERAMEKIAKFVQAKPAWTAGSTLPGGDFAPDVFGALVAESLERWPFLTEPHAKRLLHAYGRRIEKILDDAQSLDGLGPRFTGDLTGAEVRYLVAHEWAQTAEDILWRRSKLGLLSTPEERTALSEFMASLSEPSP
jgi:glycerol-3-phosphate dehydrogenase